MLLLLIEVESVLAKIVFHIFSFISVQEFQLWFAGSSGQIGRDILAFSDGDDSAANLLIILTSEPTYGKLLKDNQEVQVRGAVSQKIINQGKLRYITCLQYHYGLQSLPDNKSSANVLL